MTETPDERRKAWGLLFRTVAEKANPEPVYWQATCMDCGWAGSSALCNGGHSIADTGDYSEITCPACDSPNISDINP
jgi:hypothetical protein